MVEGPRGKINFLSRFRWPRRVVDSKKRVLLFALVFVLSILLLSIGATTATRLLLPTAPGWTLLPVYEKGLMPQNILFWMGGRSYIEAPAKEALVAAAEFLNKKYPGSRVAYMDASGRKGGKLLGHLSHKNGIDVDVLLFGKKKSGAFYPRRPALFQLGYRIKYNEQGKAGALKFDAERTFVFLKGLEHQNKAKIDRIFVEPYLKEMIIDAGRKMGITTKWLNTTLRYAGKNAADHKDHLHIRFKIQPSMVKPH